MSILTRKRDLIYLIFFLIHIPVMFCLDLVPLYPTTLIPQPLLTLRNYYTNTYHDRFFTNPPAWFTFYTRLELLYHVPLSFWAVGALLKDSPYIPLHLLPYALQTLLTTATCIIEYHSSWPGFRSEEMFGLDKLYGPYLALSIFMAIDMYGRLRSQLQAGLRSGDTMKKME